jgi:ATP-dependent RNA helicase RhlE
MSFSSLGLAEPLVRAVTELGYSQPTPIQTQAIPAVLAGGDLLAAAQTGTGKTAGFVLPILQRLMQSVPAQAAEPAAQAGGHSGRPHAGQARHARGPSIRALILTPTRELAAQVEESVRDYGRHLPLRSMAMFGGVNINPQIEQLRRRVDILVATPGRLLDHVSQRTVDLSSVEILVLDEADRMLDMGFIHDIRRVLSLLPKKRQNLLFSATFSDDIRSLANGLLDRPASIEVARRNAPAEAVEQTVLLVNRDAKKELLAHLIRERAWFQVLVFTRTKHGANRLAEYLEKVGISALAIHGNKSQSARTRALAGFKDNSLQVLVATDIAARGIDINELPHVVNFELPNVSEDYVHRIGRTGRAGAAGEAVSLVCVDEFEFLRGIEKLIGRALPRETVAGFEPDLSVRPEPISMGGGRVMRPARSGVPKGGPAKFGGDKTGSRGGFPPGKGGSRPGANGGGRPSAPPRAAASPHQGAPARSSAPHAAAGPARTGSPRPGGGAPAGQGFGHTRAPGRGMRGR